MDRAGSASHSEDMTELDTNPIQARAFNATRGPWKWTDYAVPTLQGRAGDPETYEYDTEVLEATHDHGCGCRRDCTMELTIRPEDAEFIEHARTDIDALLAEVKRLRAFVEKAESLVSSWTQPSYAYVEDESDSWYASGMDSGRDMCAGDLRDALEKVRDA